VEVSPPSLVFIKMGMGSGCRGHPQKTACVKVSIQFKYKYGLGNSDPGTSRTLEQTLL
jgi:hypothetical protein